MRSIVLLPVAASLALVAGPANAHIDLMSPPPRTESQKQGPCGAGPNDPRGPTVATYQSGETIVVTWNEFVDHPGHFRIALDDDGQDLFVDPKGFDDVSGGPGVLMDGIADKNGGDYSQEITLPDIECDNCVLQVIQVMTDKAPFGDGNDMYYQCSDIQIVNLGAGTTTAPETTNVSESSDDAGASTATPDPSAGETVTAGETGGNQGTAGETASPTGEGGGESNGGESNGGESGGGSSGGVGGSSTGDSGTDGASSDSGCGCRGGGGTGWFGMVLLPLLLRRRRA